MASAACGSANLIVRRPHVRRGDIKHQYDLLGNGKYVVCFPKLAYARLALDLVKRGAHTGVHVDNYHGKALITLTKADVHCGGEVFIEQLDDVQKLTTFLNNRDLGIAFVHDLRYWDSNSMMFECNAFDGPIRWYNP